MPLGAPELLIILVIVALVFGVGKLGDIGGALGRGIREFKHEVDSAKQPERLEDSEQREVV